jgi:hypothetical protein
VLLEGYPARLNSMWAGYVSPRISVAGAVRPLAEAARLTGSRKLTSWYATLVAARAAVAAVGAGAVLSVPEAAGEGSAVTGPPVGTAAAGVEVTLTGTRRKQPVKANTHNKTRIP